MGVEIKGKTRINIHKGSSVAEQPVGDFKVRFYDYDGTILKEQWVNSGETATAPTVPTHEYLTFSYWNNTFSGVTEDIDTGTIYNTTDGKSYLFITLTPAMSGTTPTLYINKSSTSSMTIDWGDGVSNSTSTLGVQNISHTYPGYGDYMITVNNPNGGTYNFGNNTNTTQIFGNGVYSKCLTKVYLGSNYDSLFAYTFNLCSSLQYITLPSYTLPQSSGYISVFSGCNNLKFFICPNYNMTIYTSYFNGCYNLENIIFQDTRSYWVAGTTFLSNIKIKRFDIKTFTNNTIGGSGTFNSCYSVEKFIIPSTLTSIGSAAFSNNYNCCCYLCYPTTPPTLVSTTVFSGINSLTKIYVPDASVDTYKTATNWTVVADYIYPLSTYIP